MANVVNTAGSGQEEETTGNTPLTDGGQAQPMADDTSNQFSSESGQPAVGAAPIEGQQAQTQSKKAPASSGMFTNIQKYVQKNKPQAQAMGKAVKQDVEAKAKDIRSAVEGAQKKLGEDIQRAETARTGAEEFASQQIGAITGSDPTTGQTILQGTPIQSSEQRTEGQVQAPSLTPSEEAAERYQQLLGGEIGGYVAPQTQDLSQQVLDAKKLSQMTQQAATEQGRQNLLKDTFRKQGDYTRGMSGLDQLIMAGDPAAMQQVADVQQIGQQLMQGAGVDDPNTPFIDESLGISQVGSNIAGRATTEASQMQEALQRIKDQYSKAVEGIEGDIGRRLTEVQEFQKAMSGEFGEGADLQIAKDVADALGLQEQTIYGVDPTAYYSDLGVPTAAGVMTSDELAKIQALQTLGGKDLQYGGFDEVGGYDTSKAFDMDAFQSAIQKEKEGLKVNEWSQALDTMQKRDAASGLIADVDKRMGFKDPSKMSEMELARNIGWDDARAYTAAKNELSGYNKQLENISKTIYDTPDTPGMGGASDLQFSKKLNMSDIQNALANISEKQKRKLKIV